MPYNESHSELKDHPKTKRLKRSLGVSLPAVIGHLQCLWWWVMDYAPNGDLSAFENGDIADGAEWEGDANLFVNALLSCGMGEKHGFLERTADGRLVIHDWWQYGGKLIVKRFVDNYRKRVGRVPTHTEKVAANLPLPPYDSEVEATGEGEETDVKPSSNKPPSDVRATSENRPMEVAATAPVEQKSVAKRSVTEQNESKRSVEKQQQSREARSVGVVADAPCVESLPVADFSQSEGEILSGLARSAPFPVPKIDLPSPLDHDLVESLVSRLGINRGDAVRFARESPEVSLRQLEYFPYFRGDYKVTKGAYWRKAIEGDYDPPKGYVAAQERQADAANRSAQDEIKARLQRESREKRDADDALYERLCVDLQSNPQRLEAVGVEAIRTLPEMLSEDLKKEKPMIATLKTLDNAMRQIVLRDYSP